MNYTHIEYIKCKKKKPYATKKAANKFLRSLGSSQMHSYLCPVCDAYHVGHKFNQNRLERIFEAIKKDPK